MIAASSPQSSPPIKAYYGGSYDRVPQKDEEIMQGMHESDCDSITGKKKHKSKISVSMNRRSREDE